jgi:hypothetical protein
MRYYRCNGTTFEAVQFNRNNFEHLSNFTKGQVTDLKVGEALGDTYCTLRKTDYGDIEIQEGDYVVKDIKGRFSPIKPDVFETSNQIIPTVIEDRQ